MTVGPIQPVGGWVDNNIKLHSVTHSNVILYHLIVTNTHIPYLHVHVNALVHKVCTLV